MVKVPWSMGKVDRAWAGLQGRAPCLAEVRVLRIGPQQALSICGSLATMEVSLTSETPNEPN
jgi:hypothetical protein